MKLQKPKGTQDILGEEMKAHGYVRDIANATFEAYNFEEIETPIFESYDLFSRSAGETSDIVTKEMYDFLDKGERHIALRPEGTASVARAYVENKFYAPEVKKPVKLWYQGPMFRYERPQSGRLREFHQLGVECFGSANPQTDVEILYMAFEFFSSLDMNGVKFKINSLGSKTSREAYRAALVDYLTPHEEKLSKDSQRRLLVNPLRILDSKDTADQEILEIAPSILDYLSADDLENFEEITDMLEKLGVPFEVDQKMVRGLDYYNGLVFEVVTQLNGEELTICAGGRYDGLVSYFGGPETPAFGFAIGLERLLLILRGQEILPEFPEDLQVYLAVIGEKANREATTLLAALRSEGIRAERDFLGGKLVSQYKSAENKGAELILTLGNDEVQKRVVKIKNPKTRKEIEVSFERLFEDFGKIYEEVLLGD